jgi:NifU-like protein involved in Fe-S cluster formation
MMAATRAPVLYSPELLALAVELANHPLDREAIAQGNARSRSCGSVIELSSAHDDYLDKVGLKVTACAVGQASGAIFARAAQGMDADDVRGVLVSLSDWLEGDVPSTILPRLQLLEPARPHRGRHEAILLPWRAALDALSKPPAPR